MTTVSAICNFKMLQFLFGLTIAGVVVSSPATKTKPNLDIIGGEDIDIKDAPYQVSVMISSKQSCGGTIVAPDIVITAAHCAKHNITDYLLRVGSSSNLKGGELHPVGDMVAHEGFNYETIDSDIAVMWLSKSLEFNDRVASIDMVEENEEFKEGECAIVTGWGYTLHEYPEILQRVEVPLVSEESCRNDYANFSETHPNIHITPRMLCAGLSTGGKGSCYGDSGGPLVYKGKLAGVVSWSYGCARPNYPGVYAKVSALRKWVDATIEHLRSKHSMRAQI